MQRKLVGESTSACQRLLLDTLTSFNVHICTQAIRDTLPHTPHSLLQFANSSSTHHNHTEQQKAQVTAVAHMQTGSRIRSHAVTEAQGRTHGHRHRDVQRRKWKRGWTFRERDRHSNVADGQAHRQTDRNSPIAYIGRIIAQAVFITATLLIIAIHTVRVMHRHDRCPSIDDVIISSFSRVVGQIACTAFVSDAPCGISSNRIARHHAMILHFAAVSIHVTIRCVAQ